MNMIKSSSLNRGDFSIVLLIGLFLSFVLAFWSLECMLYPVLILAFKMIFIKPFAFLHSPETEITLFEKCWEKPGRVA